MSDSNLIFENYLKIVTEMTPFAAPEEGFGRPEHITRHNPVGKLPGYGLGKVAAIRGRDVVDLTREIVNKIKTTIFRRENRGAGGRVFQYYFPGDIDELKDKVISLLITELSLGKTEATHTARIIINHIIQLADMDENGQIITTDIDAVANAPAVQRVVQQAVAPEAAAPEVAAPEVAEAPVAQRGVKLTSKYKLADARLTDPSVRNYYSILSRDIGIDQEVSGHELVSKLRSHGCSYSLSKAVLAEMIEDGALIEAPEEPDEEADIEIEEEPEYDPNEVLKVFDDLQRSAAGGRSEPRGLE